MRVDGRFWISIEDKSFLGRGKVELLKAIEKYGSISQAAKSIKMSYKAAWDSIDAMNNTADEPLVERVSGGKGGGGTVVTANGKEMIRIYDEISAKYKKFLDFLSKDSDELAEVLAQSKKISFQTSARNQFWGEVAEIVEDGLISTIKIKIKDDFFLYTTITSKSAQNMQLAQNSDVFVLIKANFFDLEHSYKNRFEVTIKNIEKSQKECELELLTDQEVLLVATVSLELAKKLDLEIDKNIFVSVDPANIIIGV